MAQLNRINDGVQRFHVSSVHLHVSALRDLKLYHGHRTLLDVCGQIHWHLRVLGWGAHGVRVVEVDGAWRFRRVRLGGWESWRCGGLSGWEVERDGRQKG